MRVLLIDNQPHVRAAIQFLLDQQPGVYVIGTADSSDVLLEQAGHELDGRRLRGLPVGRQRGAARLGDLIAAPPRHAVKLDSDITSSGMNAY